MVQRARTDMAETSFEVSRTIITRLVEDSGRMSTGGAEHSAADAPASAVRQPAAAPAKYPFQA